MQNSLLRSNEPRMNLRKERGTLEKKEYLIALMVLLRTGKKKRKKPVCKFFSLAVK